VSEAVSEVKVEVEVEGGGWRLEIGCVDMERKAHGLGLGVKINGGPKPSQDQVPVRPRRTYLFSALAVTYDFCYSSAWKLHYHVPLMQIQMESFIHPVLRNKARKYSRWSHRVLDARQHRVSLQSRQAFANHVDTLHVSTNADSSYGTMTARTHQRY
jgi:hypothetical protein